MPSDKSLGFEEFSRLGLMYTAAGIIKVAKTYMLNGNWYLPTLCYTFTPFFSEVSWIRKVKISVVYFIVWGVIPTFTILKFNYLTFENGCKDLKWV